MIIINCIDSLIDTCNSITVFFNQLAIAIVDRVLPFQCLFSCLFSSRPSVHPSTLVVTHPVLPLISAQEPKSVTQEVVVAAGRITKKSLATAVTKVAVSKSVVTKVVADKFHSSKSAQ